MDSLTLNLDAAENATDAIGSAIFGFLSNAVIPNLLLVIGACLGIWVIYRLIRYLRFDDLIYVDDVDAQVVKDYQSGAWDGYDPD